MAKVVLASQLARWLTPTPGSNAAAVSVEVSARTLKDALAAVFTQYPVLQGYVLDERGAIRHHVVAFVDDVAVTDKITLGTPLNADSEVYLFQALSGG